MADLKPAAQRVQDALRDKGLDAQVRHMPQATRSAEEAAAACGCSVGQIVKSLVFRGAVSGTPYLLLVSGANRVNQADIAQVIGEALRRPDANDVRDITGFAIGGIPPLGHNTPLATYMDAALLDYALVWAAAGTPDAVFPIAPQRLAAAAGASIISVT
ncbi:MAG TPA: YbaK/EbsC family protein [Hyphomicrobiaceae bacterium]|jgi:prolyl-tRNA editing enzyme YbaK/EbsC (Cys-tRNA(Pro) deacylase)|nr:YbaK/EbsC family protein [Hyphomicrobiaceae bacterium]